MRRDSLLVSLCIFLVACSTPDAPLGNTDYQRVLDQQPEPIEALDVLFVIDNSGSMHDQQAALIASAGDSLFAQLADENGVLPDLHVGVVSTDVGAGPDPITNCWASGDDGLLLMPETCGVDGTFLTDRDDGAGGRLRNFPGELDAAFACAADLGIDGCGFEMPLESIRRALDGSQAANNGFLREDALLLVVILSDEDDCSAYDRGMFDISVGDPLGPLSSFRCFEFGVVCDPDDPRTRGEKSACVPREDSAYISPVGEYTAFLQGLKADPSMVMVAGIFGAGDVVRVVDDPERPDDPSLHNLCPDTADAFAAVRLNTFAAGFPARFYFSSICAASMAPGLQAIARRVNGVMSANACLLGPVLSTSTCRAFAETPGQSRRALPSVTIATDAAQCGYTETRLAATVEPGTLVAGEHLVVECL